ncbi:MAG TPA: peptidylprolyl isomerase [Candidatus Eisenbacteria bacterium]|nr:peptidylprolyl isomerase [Candidatus Eisenbacteria bacterium]
MTFRPTAPPVALRRIARLLPVAAVLAFVIAGCGTRSDVLAKVGHQTVTIADFEDAAGPIAAQMPGPPDSAKKMLLDDLVRRALLIEEADRRHLVPDSAIAADRKQIGKQLALQALLQKLAPAPQVSQAEVHALYDAQANEVHTQIVFAKEEREIRDAKSAVDHGEDMGAVADRYNVFGLPPHGDLGWIVAGTLPDPVDDQLATAPVGRTMGPTQSPGTGWFLVRVLGRRAHVRPTFEAQASMLEGTLRQRKQRTALQRAVDGLKQQYDVTIAPDGAQVLFQRYNTPRDSAAAFGNPPPPTPAEGAHVLASWRDARGTHGYTLGDAVHELQDPTVEKPDFSRVPQITQWLESRVLQQVAAAEAERRHLTEDPDVARKIQERLDNEKVQAMFELAGEGVKVDSNDVRAAWQRHASALVHVTSAHLAVATTRDSAAAFALAARAVGTGAPLRASAAAVKPAVPVADRTVSFPTRDPLWQGLQAALTATTPGQTRGPYRVPGGWMVYQLVDKQQSAMRFEELSPQIVQALQNEALEGARERRLQALTDSLRTALRPEIHPERLAKVKWPAANAAPVRMPGG